MEPKIVTTAYFVTFLGGNRSPVETELVRVK